MTNKILNNCIKHAVVFFVFFVSSAFANSEYLLVNGSGLVGNRTIQKIDEIGKELYEKTNLKVYAVIDKTINNETLRQYINSHVKDKNTQYVALVIITDDYIADIFPSSFELNSRYKKDKILSPFPFSGTVLPIIGDNKKGDEKYGAALLNGYADLTDQIASSYNIKLESSIGNSNRNTLNFFRVLIYGFLIVVMIIYMKKIIKARYAKK